MNRTEPTTTRERQGEILLQQGDLDGLTRLLSEAPLTEILSSSVLLRQYAHVLRNASDSDGASLAFERARFLAAQETDYVQYVACAGSLIRFLQQQEKITQARAYFDSLEAYVRQLGIQDSSLEAQLILMLGRLCPDLGKNAEAIALCTKALHLYERLGNVHGQIQSLWALTTANIYLAHLSEAAGNIEQALRLFRAADLKNEELYLFLKNLQARHALYSGEIKTGLAVVTEVIPLMRRYPHSKATLYLTVTEAELYRQQGKYPAALATLQRVEEIMNASDDHGFQPWLQMQRSWTEALAGKDIAIVRRELTEAIEWHNPATKRTGPFHLAALYTLEERWSDAVPLFESVLAECRKAGELFEVFACHVYLAYIYLVTGKERDCKRELESALGWAEDAACTGFPYLWHPHIVATTCVEAIRIGVRPRQAEIMILRTLGDAAVPYLLRLRDVAELDVRQRVRSAVAAVDVNHTLRRIDALSAEPGLRDILLEHLIAGRLALNSLDTLAERLRNTKLLKTASTPVIWQCIAIFGFYAATQMPRGEIATHFRLSDSPLARYISAIRSAFGVESRTGRDTNDEGRRLVSQYAIEHGLVLTKGDFFPKT